MSEPLPSQQSADTAMLDKGIFASANCDQIDLRYRVARDIFDWQRFLSFFGIDKEELGNRVAVTCRTLDPENLDYHIHFYFDSMKDAFILYVSFHAGSVEKSGNEREPYAERFMPWLGSFFSNETAHADLHAEFEYKDGARRSRLPLPIKIGIGVAEAEIIGISASLTPAQDGVSDVNIRQGKKALTIGLIGATRTQFSTFDIKSEVEKLSLVALSLTEAEVRK